MSTEIADAPGPKETTKDRHIPALDGVRGLAILLVVLYHYCHGQPVLKIDRIFFALAESGWIGVDLFFVLSGFLITGILWDVKGGPSYFKSFYLRRVLRIFPLYYAFLIVFIFVLPLLHQAGPREAKLIETQAYYWTYLSNVLTARRGFTPGVPGQQFWSLAIEEQFYLIWPAVVLLCSRRRLLVTCVACIVAAPALRIAMLVLGTGSLPIYVLTPTRMDALAVGALLALLARSPGGLARLIPAARYIAVGALLVVAMMFAVMRSFVFFAVPVQVVGYTVLALGFGALLVLVAAPAKTTRLGAFFSHPAMRFWGRYSYGLYIVHPQVGRFGFSRSSFPVLLGSQIPRTLLCAAANTALSMVVAVVSFHLFEKQFLKLKNLFPYGASPDTEKPVPVVVPPVEPS